jgi:hypothetical protein
MLDMEAFLVIHCPSSRSSVLFLDVCCSDSGISSPLHHVVLLDLGNHLGLIAVVFGSSEVSGDGNDLLASDSKGGSD